MIRTILAWTLWPLGVVSVLASILFFADLGSPRSIFEITGRTFLVALVVLLVIELVLPYRTDWKVRGDRDIWRDIGHSVLYGQVGALIASFVFIAGFAAILEPLHLPSLWPAQSPVIAQVLLVIVVGDFFEYWLHRLSHKIPALWHLHAVHHMPTRLHMLKAGRHHVLYFPLRGLMVWVPLALLGVPPELIAWQFVAIVLTGNIDHANIDFRIPAFMHRVLVTPQFHRVHHSADTREGNSNFGVMLPIWDMIFGTHVDPVKNDVRNVGIEGDPIPHRFFPELLGPLSPKR